MNMTDSAAVEMICNVFQLENKFNEFNIQVKNNIKQISVEFLKDDKKWFAKVFLKRNQLLFVTINIEKDKWDFLIKNYNEVIESIVLY